MWSKSNNRCSAQVVIKLSPLAVLMLTTQDATQTVRQIAQQEHLETTALRATLGLVK